MRLLTVLALLSFGLSAGSLYLFTKPTTHNKVLSLIGLAETATERADRPQKSMESGQQGAERSRRPEQER